jgi:hypothetical protein
MKAQLLLHPPLRHEGGQVPLSPLAVQPLALVLVLVLALAGQGRQGP